MVRIAIARCADLLRYSASAGLALPVDVILPRHGDRGSCRGSPSRRPVSYGTIGPIVSPTAAVAWVVGQRRWHRVGFGAIGEGGARVIGDHIVELAGLTERETEAAEAPREQEGRASLAEEVSWS